MNTTNVTASTANTNSGSAAAAQGSLISTGPVDSQLATITAQRQAIAAQTKALDEAEAKLRAQAEEAVRAKVKELPQYLGVVDLNAVMGLIRSALRGTPKTTSGKRPPGTPIPDDIKEAIDRALRAHATIPSLHRHFGVSLAWLAVRKRNLKLTNRKGAKRIDYADLPKAA